MISGELEISDSMLHAGSIERPKVGPPLKFHQNPSYIGSQIIKSLIKSLNSSALYYQGKYSRETVRHQVGPCHGFEQIQNVPPYVACGIDRAHKSRPSPQISAKSSQKRFTNHQISDKITLSDCLVLSKEVQ